MAILVFIAQLTLAITAVIVIPGLLLGFAGKFFDLSLTWTVLNFTQNTLPLLDSIKIVWTAARDIANILIIGMFVYIAIAKILSLQKDFKGIIVNILSVAILINFSFFFAQVPIDISNWASVQIYNSTMYQSVSEEGSSMSTTLIENMGGTYTLGMMIDSLGESLSGMVKGMAESAVDELKFWNWGSEESATPAISPDVDPSSGLMQGIAMGISSIVLTLATAILFFRIAFILIGRWIILILLMATSSLAFAAMLIPAFNKYWIMWRNGLVYNSVLAPLLLFMLSVVVILMSGLQNVLSANPGAMNAIFIFLIGLGLLWAAIRISTMLSTNAMNSAGGAGKWVNGVLGGIQGKAIGGVMAGVGFAGRNTLGKGFAGMGDRLEKLANTRYGNSKGVGRLIGDSIGNIGMNMNKTSKKGFDVRTTGVFKNIMKGTGVEAGKGIREGFAVINAKKAKDRESWGKKHDEAITKTSKEKLAYETERDRALSLEAQDIRESEKISNEEIAALQRSTKAEESNLKDNERQHQDLKEKGGKIADEMKENTEKQEELRSKIKDTSGKTGDMKKEEQEIAELQKRLSNLRRMESENTSELSAVSTINTGLTNSISQKKALVESLLAEQDSSGQVGQARLNKIDSEREAYTELVENEALTLAQGLSAVRALAPDTSKGTVDAQIATLETERRNLKARIDSATDATNKKDLQEDKSTIERMEKNITKMREYKRTLQDSKNKKVSEMRQTAAQSKDSLRKKQLEDAYIEFANDTTSGKTSPAPAPSPINSTPNTGSTQDKT